MIIRKPYAFLIKYFRLIHLFMLILTSYILYKSYNIYQFFNDYVATRQVIYSPTLSSDYIPLIILLISLFIIVFFGSIFILFKQKDKPKLLYILGIIFYSLFIILCIVSRSSISTIVIEGLEPRVSRVVRDIWLILFLAQIGFVIVLLIRTSGFDFKRFDFKEDIQNLNITDEDNEEIELSTRFDADRLKMKVAMQKEELKSFFYENRLVIIILLFIVFIVLPGAFVSKQIVENKRYKENEVVEFDNMNLKITDSYLTKKDYKNNVLLKDENIFLIVKINIASDIEKQGITLDNLRLETNNKVYLPTTTYYNSFIDMGTGYETQKVGKSNKDYIAIYLLNEEDISENMVIRYTDKIIYKNKEMLANYKRIIINPESTDNTINEKQILFNQNYIFKDDTLKNISISINSFEVKEYFAIPNSKKLIVNNIGYVLKLDYKINGNKEIVDIINQFGELSYTYNDKEYKESIRVITPKGYKDSIYLAVDQELRDAEGIKLKLVIRNNIYTWIFK